MYLYIIKYFDKIYFKDGFMKNIKIDFDVLEMMVFFWESVASKDKMGDDYFAGIAEKPQMEIIYNEEFSKNSVRRVLSAISNRERLNDRTPLESRFWNNNMWILEDLQTMHNIMAPIKTLNLKDVLESKNIKSEYDEIEVIFIPGHAEEFYVKENKIYINFFKLIPDVEDPKNIKIAGLSVKDYVIKKLEANYRG